MKTLYKISIAIGLTFVGFKVHSIHRYVKVWGHLSAALHLESTIKYQQTNSFGGMEGKVCALLNGVQEVGYLQYTHARLGGLSHGKPYVRLLHVNPDFRGQGIANKLLARAFSDERFSFRRKAYEFR